MLNHIVLMGRLTRDPKLQYTESNIPVASARIAVERDYDRETADFIDITAWRQKGEFLAKYFEKGQMIAVSGRLQMREWTDRDGNRRTGAEVVAEQMYFCGGKAGDRERISRTPEDAAETGSAFREIVGEEDGELPF